MPGPVRSIIRFGALGGAASLAVAWASVLHFRNFAYSLDMYGGGFAEQNRSAATPQPEHIWPFDMPGPSNPPSYRYIVHTRATTVDVALSYYWGCKTGYGRGAAVITSGWPLRAMRWDMRQIDEPEMVLNDPTGAAKPRPEGFLAMSIWRSGLPLPELRDPALLGPYAPMQWVRLPLRPVLLGLFADSALFGACGWLLVGGPRKLRAAIRRREARCARCGYPVRGLTTCPECGVAADQPTDAPGSAGHRRHLNLHCRHPNRMAKDDAIANGVRLNPD
jgi:hypothetical protein